MKKGQKIYSDSKPIRVPVPIIQELDLESKIQDFREREMAQRAIEVRREKGLPIKNEAPNDN
jgi:hypothetical protein